MKKRLSLILVLMIGQIALAELWTTVYYADEVTPLELADPCVPYLYRDIMVGTKLAIVVSSDTTGTWVNNDANGYWWDSDLAIIGDYMSYGVLSGRDCNEEIGYECSCLEAAGPGAFVQHWGVSDAAGFGLYPHRTSIPGDWFIIDYTALKAGECMVDFYNRSIDPNVPAYQHVFNQVPTRDFDGDTTVDFGDFCLLASHWQETGLSDPNMCHWTDINEDGTVNIGDLGLFADYWLYATQ